LQRIAIAGALAVAVWILADVLLLVFAGILVAVAFRGSAAWVSAKTRLPVGWSMTIVALVVAAAFAAAFWWGGTGFADEAGQLWQRLGAEWKIIREHLQGTAWGRQILLDIDGQHSTSSPSALARGFAGAAIATFGVLGSIVLVLIAGIYLAIQPDLYRTGVLALLPIPSRGRGGEVLGAIGRALSWWLIGRAIDMVAVVALTFVGLALLDVPLALVLALIAGLLNFVPYIGAVAGAVPAVLVAFGQDPMQALWVALLFVAIQTLEGYLLAPQIQQHTVHLPPAVTIMSQAAFGTLFGMLGLLLAPALAVAFIVVVRMVYIEDTLGDPSPSGFS
jgi:predicted PurR-regulated permease PerM